MPYILSFVVAAILGGLAISKWRLYREVTCVGLAVWSVASGLMAIITKTTPLGVIVAYQIVGGLGTGAAYVSCVRRPT